MANILIVDDAADIIQVLGFVLKKQGHTVTSAMDGTKALDIAHGIQDLKVAFVDFNLPDMTGSVLAAALRKNHPGLKIIMLSGQEGVDAQSQGVDAFMLKPFTSEQIKKKLEVYL